MGVELYFGGAACAGGSSVAPIRTLSDSVLRELSSAFRKILRQDRPPFGASRETPPSPAAAARVHDPQRAVAARQRIVRMGRAVRVSARLEQDPVSVAEDRVMATLQHASNSNAGFRWWTDHGTGDPEQPFEDLAGNQGIVAAQSRQL